MFYRIIFWDKAVRIELPKSYKSLYWSKVKAIESAKYLSKVGLEMQWKVAVVDRFTGKVVYVCV